MFKSIFASYSVIPSISRGIPKRYLRVLPRDSSQPSHEATARHATALGMMGDPLTQVVALSRG